MLAKRPKMIIALVLALIASTYMSTQLFIGQTPEFNIPLISTLPGTIKYLVQKVVKTTTSSTPVQSIYQTTSPIAFISAPPTPTPLTATPLIVPSALPTLHPTSSYPTPRPTLVPTLRTPTPKPTSIPPTFPQKQPVSCPSSSSEQYGSLSIISEPTTNASTHADINLQVRGYNSTNATLDLVDVGGDNDAGKAPQLSSVFLPKRKGSIASTYRVNNWDWDTKSRGGPIEDPKATLVGLGASPGEAVYVPSSAYSIGDGKQVLVLYATNTSLTLKYTREDNVISGYTLHYEDICVDPNLLSLYNSLNGKGRGNLPALEGGKKVGTARTSEVKVAIRDTGSFMDPRVRKDWWLGY